MRKMFIVSFGATMLAGCSSPPVLEDHSRVLNTTPICCSSVGEAKFTTLTDGNEVRVDVSTHSAAFSFPEGKSFFHAYRIQSANRASSKLTVRTFAVNTATITSAHVLIPRLAFFDSAFNQIETVSPELTFHRPKFAIGESWWQGDVSVASKAAYVVVYSNFKEKATVLRMPDSDAGAIYAGGTLMPNSRGYRLIPGGPTGEISLLLNK
jgi:hypothetical protein